MEKPKLQGMIFNKGKMKNQTDDALKWFPELKDLLVNFDVEHISIRLKDSDEVFKRRWR